MEVSEIIIILMLVGIKKITNVHLRQDGPRLGINPSHGTNHKAELLLVVLPVIVVVLTRNYLTNAHHDLEVLLTEVTATKRW